MAIKPVQIIQHPMFGGWIIKDLQGKQLVNILFRSYGAAERYVRNNPDLFADRS